MGKYQFLFCDVLKKFKISIQFYKITSILYSSLMSSIIIAYGSFKGKGRGFANELALKYGIDAVPMNEVSIDQVMSAGICIFIVSTFGKGVFPENAEKFYANLQQSKADLSNVRYAVLGLGSSKHKLYDQAGRDLYKELQSHNAQPLCPLYEVDSRAADLGISSYLKWTRELESFLPISGSKGIKESFKLTQVSQNEYHQVPPKDYSYTHIVESSLLLSGSSTHTSHMYTLQLPENIKYLAGDHFDILPRNDENLVSKAILSLHLSAEQVYKVETTRKDCLIPEIISIQELFGQYIDLQGLPTQFMIKAFRDAAEENHNSEGKEKLLKLNDPDELTKFLEKTSVFEFITEFSVYGVPSLNVLVSVLPLMSPRTYSVSTAPNDENKAKIMVTDIVYGNNKIGLCTGFLSRADQKTQIPLKVIKGVYNQEQDVPMLLFGVGVGIAPLCSVIEDRRKRNFKSPTVLFFGWRHEDESRPLLQMIEKLKEDGALTDAKCGFSRDHEGRKYYIYDLLNDNKELVWNYWKNPETAVYYCGPALGIPEKLKDGLEGIIVEKKGCSADEAAKACKKHTWYLESF